MENHECGEDSLASAMLKYLCAAGLLAQGAGLALPKVQGNTAV